jgi:hypothetical protein
MQKMGDMAAATTKHSHNSIYISQVPFLYYLSFFSDTMALISSAVPRLIATVVILKGLLQSLPSCTEVPE